VIAGIDYSTHAVDVVLLDEDSDAATWHRWPLHGDHAFDRVRSIHSWKFTRSFWDDVLAIGIEEPRGYNAGALYRVQGAILGKLPPETLVHPLIPSVWRKTVGLPGNASKQDVWDYVDRVLPRPREPFLWPQDACDAYCIALATRTLLVQGAAC
jgi:hypothetical protein